MSFLIPYNFSLSPVSSRNSVVQVFMSFVRSSSSLTVDYTISMKRCLLRTHDPRRPFALAIRHTPVFVTHLV